jgi:hypothetical protein
MGTVLPSHAWTNIYYSYNMAYMRGLHTLETVTMVV